MIPTGNMHEISGYRPRSVPKGMLLMHNFIIHGPNWRTGINGFRAWIDTEVPEGFVPCPCGWAGLPHFSYKEHVQSYREDPRGYQLRVRYQELAYAKVWSGEDLSKGPHKWGDLQVSANTQAERS